MSRLTLRPSPAYVTASWAALLTGAVAYAVGLVNAEMMLNEKGYYLTVLAFGLFAVVSLQKSIRDQAEHVPVSRHYVGACVGASGLSLTLLVVGLWNADLLLSEKGFYGMAFALALFGAVTVQKNVRDAEVYDRLDPLADDVDVRVGGRQYVEA